MVTGSDRSAAAGIAGEGAGIALARAYFEEIVRPILQQAFPGMTYAAGRVGAGSDVLGLDDETSRDHDWGLRLNLFVPEGAVGEVDRLLGLQLPERFRGWPTRFPFTGESLARHHVHVDTVSGFVSDRLGFDPATAFPVRDWLSISGQAALEIVAGPVFTDDPRDLTNARRAIEWYPDDLWRYVLAADWTRLAQELPILGRADDVGDRLGAQVIAARLVQATMHLAFMLERRWPPYAKWFGSMFRRLSCAAEVGGVLHEVLEASRAGERQRGIAQALDVLLLMQNDLGLTSVPRATVPFWGRPYLQPDPLIAAQLADGVVDPMVRALPAGFGAIDQRTDNIDILVRPASRRAMVNG